MTETTSKFDALKQKLKAGFQELAKERAETSSISAKTITPREYPKGARVHQLPSQQSDTAVLSLPTHYRSWWIVPAFLAIPLIMAAITWGGSAGFVPDEWVTDTWGRQQYRAGYFTYAPMIMAITITVGALIFVHFRFNRHTTITITPDMITIGRFHFDRKYAGSLRLGYEIDYQGDQSSFIRGQFLFSGLRLSYGPWGEDLPYMVDRYHAAEYVNWVNLFVEQVGSPPAAENNASEGRREQIF